MPQRALSTLAWVCVFASTLVAAAELQTDHFKVAAPKAQLFEGLGSYTWPITTDSKEAQTYFNQGIAWMHAFNHDEAIRSFAKAAELDPDSAMAWWAISHCEGPNYNSPVMDEDRQERSWGALQEALARIDTALPIERALIEALTARYEKPWPDDRAHLEKGYADALAQVWAQYPKNPNVGALYAEAMMLQRPWKLYTPVGSPLETRRKY